MTKLSFNALDQASVQAAAISSERIKGDIITQTLDKLNAPLPGKSAAGDMGQTYEFSKSVLEGAYLGKGTIVDSARPGGDLVTQTLDKLNAPTGGSSSGMSETYNFSQDVLSGAYLGKGTVFSSDS